MRNRGRGGMGIREGERRKGDEEGGRKKNHEGLEK